jgi:hypothetical protein
VQHEREARAGNGFARGVFHNSRKASGGLRQGGALHKQ